MMVIYLAVDSDKTLGFTDCRFNTSYKGVNIFVLEYGDSNKDYYYYKITDLYHIE